MGLDLTGLGSVFDFGTKVLERIFPDPAERLKAQTALEQMKSSGELAKLTAETDLLKGQLEINKVEAASPKLLIAGWRPYLGWVCGAAFTYGYVVLPFLQFFVYLWGSPETIVKMKQLPQLDLAAMVPVLFGMLGLAKLRTDEKIKGAEGNR